MCTENYLEYTILAKLKTLNGAHLYWLCPEWLLLIDQLLVFFVTITSNSYQSTSCYLSFEESLVSDPFPVTGSPSLGLEFSD